MTRAGSRAAIAPATVPGRDQSRTRSAAPVAVDDAAAARAAYVERALLLWPRLDRSRLRRCANNPSRIAEYVRRRTSQPLDAILAMLTQQSPALAPTEESSGFESGTVEKARLAIHIVRDDDETELAKPILA